MEHVPQGEPGISGFLCWLTERIAYHGGRPVVPGTPIAECGLDSVAMLSLFGDVEEKCGSLIGPEDMWACPTVRDLAHRLVVCGTPAVRGRRIRVAFVFGGQGGQHPGMAGGLYRDSATYRACLGRFDEMLRPCLGRSVVESALGRGPDTEDTALSQSALFAVGCALAQTLLDAGVRPVAVLGHGMGELAAAAVAGAVPFADAARLVVLRGASVQRLPEGGGMLAVCVGPYEAAEAAACEPGVSIGAVNAARATVLSGTLDGLGRVRDRLARDGVLSRFLPVRYAFHSPLMEPVVPELRAAAEQFGGAVPRLPYYSAVYGRQSAEPLGAAYWAQHITSPVRFADAVREMLHRHAPTHVVEIGPRPVLTPFVRRIGGPEGPRCLPVCQGPQSDAVDLAGVLSELDAGPLAESTVRW
ncbi:acyltransferase domain-containing protein [Streptomyces morookaense]|uniref:Acyltransferase domain-containing protein n=1 Tax=Streptomyces morookaense TaxID=1970 RepID=A0A7Y7B268_STRMO|nr:acyltransferase domain-containing protein [Streptomyces morookaense]NVK77484.1 acyltransferase domain-containing protein [Streptomyces morookaense]GHF22024.1 hypothetical protein GCM10010359_24640 [Streptomyces morookaense]